MDRRKILGLAAGGLAASIARPAIAQGTWPDKPVKVIVPYAAGGGTDTIARPWAEKLSQAFGQPFVIENRGGASGTIGAEAAAKSAPDGSTLLFTPNNTLNIFPLLKKTNYDPLKSFAPISRAGDMVTGFAVHPSVGVKTFKELIEYAKKNPGKLVFASSGVGTATQMRVEMLKLKAGIDILHVPYRGGADGLNDLLAGTAHLMNETITTPHIKAGKLALLNVNHSERSAQFPDVPTLTELGFPGADVPIWFSLWAPAGTPKEITAKIAAKMAEIGKDAEFKSRLTTLGFAPVVSTPEQLIKFLEEDGKINEGLIKTANIKLD